MAATRANLSVSPDLVQMFSAAQNGTCRYIHAIIENDTILPSGEQPVSGTDEEDFTKLVATLEEQTPGYYLFSPSEEGDKKWILVAYVPENCGVRKRMLYASCREDIRQALGHSNFKAEFYANAKEDMTYANLMSSTGGGSTVAAPLTDCEIIAAEEAKTDRRAVKASAMGVVPFSMSADLRDAMMALVAGDKNWVELVVDLESESLQLVSSATVDMDGDITALVHAEEARYFAVEFHKNKYLAFCCPEETPIRTKMVFSTAKAALQSEVAPLGINFTKMLEFQQPAELAAELAAANADLTRDTKLVTTQYSRPKRPGRGRRRLVGRK